VHEIKQTDNKVNKTINIGFKEISNKDTAQQIHETVNQIYTCLRVGKPSAADCNDNIL